MYIYVYIYVSLSAPSFQHIPRCPSKVPNPLSPTRSPIPFFPCHPFFAYGTLDLVDAALAVDRFLGDRALETAEIVAAGWEERLREEEAEAAASKAIEDAPAFRPSCLP